MKKATAILTQQEKAEQFYDLHHSGKLLILPNIWDSLGALLLQNIGYPAVASASASVAFSNGFNDGENIPFDELLVILERIAGNVNIPVTADIESGYADDEQQLKQNITHLIEAGIVGINIEDTDKNTGTLIPVKEQCEKIKVIKKVAEETGVSFFINARTDVYLLSHDNNKLDETIQRGFAYKDAGADCFYPITMNNSEDIISTIQHLQMPVNVIIMPGIAALSELEKMGVARVSLGPGFLKYAIKSMKNLAEKLMYYEGMNDIIENEITSEYFKELVLSPSRLNK
jgi:2-methylisocitrate lyase-like PEP mutase family enzyme